MRFLTIRIGWFHGRITEIELLLHVIHSTFSIDFRVELFPKVEFSSFHINFFKSLFL